MPAIRASAPYVALWFEVGVQRGDSEELAELEAVEDEAGAFPRDEQEDADNEDDRRQAARKDEDLHRPVDPPGGIAPIGRLR